VKKMKINRNYPNFRRFIYVTAMSSVNFLLKIAPFSVLRLIILKLVGVKCGWNVTIGRAVRLDFPWRLSIGSNCYIGRDVYFDCRGGLISVGENTDISEGVFIYTLAHDIQSDCFCVKSGDVHIGNRNWICARSIILPGARLGIGSVLSANSVYSGSSDNLSLLVGNPAKTVKKLNSDRASRVRQ
jgi:putative colanic acid biosynthesis acetyltransferase WcaF